MASPITTIYRSGEDGYDTFRIPVLLPLPGGALLAFCEGRRQSASDTGAIEILLKRSRDNGVTWSNHEVIWSDGPNTCGNPCPVFDTSTGTIHLLLTHNLGEDHEDDIVRGTARGTRTVWVARSTDGGLSWSAPENITASAKDPDWGWYATGPGIGIQLRHGPYAGRLVVPCDHSHRDPAGKFRLEGFATASHVLFSDDHGNTWQRGAAIGPDCNECQLAELRDGALLINMRCHAPGNRRRQAVSRDGGRTWSAPQPVPDLVEPICQAGLLAIEDENGQDLLVFSNPARGTPVPGRHSLTREGMTVRASVDGGATWPVSRLVFGGPSAYSSPGLLQDGTLGVLFECGQKNAYESIAMTTLSLESLKP